MSATAFRVQLVASAVIAALFAVALLTRSVAWVDASSSLLASVAAVAAMVVALRRYRPERYLPWIVLAVGTVFAAVPRSTILREALGDQHPLLLIGGGVGSLLSIVAPLLLLRLRTGAPDRDGAVDGWIMALSLAALFRQVLLVGGDQLMVPAVFTAVLTFVAGITLAAAIRLVFLSWRLPSAWLLLVAATAGQAIGLSIAVMEPGTAGDPTAAVVFGTVNTLFIGLAAAHPSMRRLTTPAERLDALPRSRLVVLGLALLMTVVAVLREAGREVALAFPGITVVLVLGLVLVRVVRLVSQREHARHLQAAIVEVGERALDEADEAALLSAATNGLVTALPADAVAVLALPPEADGLVAPRVLAVSTRDHDDACSPMNRITATAAADVERALPGHAVAVPVPGPSSYVVVAHRRGRRDFFTIDERAAVCTVATLLATALRRQAADARTRHDALHDQLTGLPNRAWLMAAMDAVDADLGPDGRTGLLFLDLDRFKAVNDTFGHAVGDELLVEVAARLRAELDPDRHSVARLAGDEFVVLLRPPVDEAAAAALADRLAATMRRPFTLSACETSIGVSVGVAIGGGPTEALLHSADAAMYRHKSEGRRASDAPPAQRRAGESTPTGPPA